MNSISVGNLTIGMDARPIIIAEVGINHNGSVKLAMEMIGVAGSNGADMVKLQSFQPDKFLASNQPNYDQIEKLSLSFDEQEELFNFAKGKKIPLFSTVFDNETADFLERMEVPAYKIASMDCTNIPLLRYTARKGKPIFLSTGMADINEVAEAVEIVGKEGNDRLILMHCVSDYPTDIGRINLKTMTAMSEKFGLFCGFSDHSVGLHSAFTAGALGAVAIEKHFTLDRSLSEEYPYSDHAISIEPDELKALSEYCKNLPVIMGSAEKILSDNESENRSKFRRGIYAARDIEKGTILTENDLIPLRPEGSTPVSKWDDLIGRKAIKKLKKGESLNLQNLE